jgi:hypothetical protein
MGETLRVDRGRRGGAEVSAGARVPPLGTNVEAEAEDDEEGEEEEVVMMNWYNDIARTQRPRTRMEH